MNWDNPCFSILSFPLLFFPWIDRGIPLPHSVSQHGRRCRTIRVQGGHPLPSQESEKSDSDCSRCVIFRESLGSTVPLPENIRSSNSEFCMTILERPGPILIQWCFLRGEKGKGIVLFLPPILRLNYV